MRVVDLFAGLGGWSEPARERGYDVLTVDIDPRFGTDLVADVLQLRPEDLGPCDLLLASPPCEAFSTMSFGHHWHAGRIPATRHAETSIALVAKTLELVDALDPPAWILENPVGMLRKLPVVGGRERRTVTYCQLGEIYRKPTDLFGGFPPSLRLPAPCSNGSPCHVAAPRGSRTGVQGELAFSTAGGSEARRSLAALRAKIPRQLSELVLAAAAYDLAAGRRYEPPPSLFEELEV